MYDIRLQTLVDPWHACIFFHELLSTGHKIYRIVLFILEVHIEQVISVDLKTNPVLLHFRLLHTLTAATNWTHFVIIFNEPIYFAAFRMQLCFDYYIPVNIWDNVESVKENMNCL